MSAVADRLEYSPLTHEELNDRVDQTRDQAGGYAMAVCRSGYDFAPAHTERLAAITRTHDAYLSAALQRTKH